MAHPGVALTQKPVLDLEVSAVRLFRALMIYWRVMPT